MRKIIENKTNRKWFKQILDLREALYNETLLEIQNQTEWTEEERNETIEHLKKQYKQCSKKRLCDGIYDTLLDSFGS